MQRPKKCLNWSNSEFWLPAPGPSELSPLRLHSRVIFLHSVTSAALLGPICDIDSKLEHHICQVFSRPSIDGSFDLGLD